MARKCVAHVAAVALALPIAFGATIARSDSLVDVVQESLENHPELGAIRFNRRAIDNELNAARGLNLPSIELRADTGRHSEDSRTGAGIVQNNDWHSRDGVGVIFSQRIFDGFESRHEIARQRNRVESARWRVNDTANSIALRAVQAYLECIRANAVLTAARNNLTAHQGLLSRVTKRADAGVANSAESAEAAARAANAKAIVAEAEARAQDAQALFKSVVGRMPAKLSAASAARGVPNTVEAAVGEAVSAAPSVIATQFDAIAAEAAVGSAYSRFSPKVNLEIGSNHGWGLVEEDDRNFDASAMLVVRWNLFNGGIDKSRVWEARARALEANQISANTARNIERETRVSWDSVRASEVRVPALRKQLELQRKRRAAYLEQFDTGQRRLLDILDVQNEIFVVDSSLRTEELIGIYSGYRLLAAMGRLVPGLGLELPEEGSTAPAPTLLNGWRTELQSWPRENYHDRAAVEAVPTK